MRYELRVIHNVAVLVCIAACVVGVAAFCHTAEGLWALLLVFAGVSYQNEKSEAEPDRSVVDSLARKIVDNKE